MGKANNHQQQKKKARQHYGRKKKKQNPLSPAGDTYLKNGKISSIVYFLAHTN